MFELISNIISFIAEKYLDRAMESKDKSSHFAIRLYEAYKLIDRAIDNLSSASFHLEQTLSGGIWGPSGDPLIKASNELSRIAKEYCSGFAFSEDLPITSFFGWIKRRKQPLDLDAIALFNQELADALIEPIGEYDSLPRFSEDLFDIPSFTGNSHGLVSRTYIDSETPQRIKKNGQKRIDIKKFAKQEYFNLRAKDKEDIKRLYELFQTAIESLKTSRKRLKNFIIQNYTIEDLLESKW